MSTPEERGTDRGKAHWISGEMCIRDRAKALLMDRHGITEEQAHYYLQKKSMDSRTKLALTARLVLDSKTME